MKLTDPVCGMQIGIEKAEAQEDFEGWAYFFCSDQCRQIFKSAPARYAASARTGRHPIPTPHRRQK
tara:strand:- start:3927 stop:4124 length:198 start_codon:yes stop_codon:yes gene_type:complete